MLPLAAGINEGGHYFRYFGPSGVRALPLAAGIKEGGHYFFLVIIIGDISCAGKRTYPARNSC